MMTPCSIIDADDKYAKANKGSQGVFSKYREALSILGSPRGLLLAAYRTGFLPYLCLLLACAIFYCAIGGNIMQVSRLAALRYVSTVAEAFGLIVLRQRIKRHRSAAGISGKTIAMYVWVYAIRELLMVPAFNIESLDDWMVEILTFASLLMVLDVMRSVFKTYRRTYQEHLDVLSVKYLLPGCFVLAFLLHPELNLGLTYNYTWTLCLYLDVVALMPQVTMMWKGKGKVAAPISHFVAATALSRLLDLEFWYFGINLVSFWSAMLIIFFHVVHLLLIADFMYYYVKARLNGASASQDLVLPTCVAVA